MPKRKPDTTAENHNSTIFVCQFCDGQTESFADFLAHVTTAHDITEAQVRASKGEMTMHMDARDWHQTDHAFALEDGRPLVLRSVRVARRGADRDYWR